MTQHAPEEIHFGPDGHGALAGLPEREDAANKPDQSGAIGCNVPVRDYVEPHKNIPSGINILADALACTQGDRQAIYGSPVENWNRTRDIFNSMTGLSLTTSQCVDLAIAMKLARLYKTPNHRDSMVDLAGYAWVKSEVAR